MLEQFQEYFTAIDLPQPIREKAEQLCQAYAGALPGPLEDVFISDAFEPDGARRYRSLWLKTPLHVMESHNFVVGYSMDFTALLGVQSAEFIRSDLVSFDDGPTTPATRLMVRVRFRNQLEGHLQAAHNNCKYLYRFTVRNLMPRGQS